MKKNHSRKLLFFAVFFVLFSFIAQSVMADDRITVDFFYSSKCGSCTKKIPIINEIAEKYQSNITVNLKDIADNDTNLHEYQIVSKNYSVTYPFVLVRNNSNSTVIKYNMTVVEISRVIDAYINGTYLDDTTDDLGLVVVDIFGFRMTVDVSSLSLPVLTVVLGGLDSFNPCAFFILIFLLNLMLYARSRRRMLLVGGVFIFFSGLLYYIFMFILYSTFVLTSVYVDVVTWVAGAVAVVLGAVSIKDFFFFKKGVSLSIPEEKKPGLFKRMRDLVKTPQIVFVVSGTIVLAAVVNFYELLCTLGLPLVYTRQLASYNLSLFDSYLYIFFYNVVYVIPLVVIVLIFVFTLGRLKLSEWHGRVLKLLSGVMLVSFGLLFFIDYKVLQNVVTPVLLLVFSIVFTYVVSFIWKKRFSKKELK